MGFEPIEMQQFGGLLLAAGLDGGNSLIKSNLSSNQVLCFLKEYCMLFLKSIPSLFYITRGKEASL